MCYDRAIGDNQEAAFGRPRERFDRALDIGGIVADLFWDGVIADK
jgi:hypothetical protein